MPTIARDGYTYRVTPEHEYDGPERYFVSGDDDLDARDCAAIRKDLEWNEWAWCVAHVECWRTDIPEIVGADYLGGCNYASADDFMQPGDYFDDMCDSARAECDATLARIAALLAPHA